MTARMLIGAFLLTGGLIGCQSTDITGQVQLGKTRADLLFTHDVSPTALSRYNTVEFQPVATTLGRRACPPELLRHFDRYTDELEDLLREEYVGGPPVVSISSEIIHFQRSGLCSNAMMLARIKMRGRHGVIVDAIARSEAPTCPQGTEDQMARAAVIAIGRYLRQQKHIPTPDPNDL